VAELIFSACGEDSPNRLATLTFPEYVIYSEPYVEGEPPENLGTELTETVIPEQTISAPCSDIRSAILQVLGDSAD